MCEKNIPETKAVELKEEELEQASGGEVIILVHPVRHKVCAANPSHVYVATHNACPECGEKAFTFL